MGQSVHYQCVSVHPTTRTEHLCLCFVYLCAQSLLLWQSVHCSQCVCIQSSNSLPPLSVFRVGCLSSSTGSVVKVRPPTWPTEVFVRICRLSQRAEGSGYRLSAHHRNQACVCHMGRSRGAVVWCLCIYPSPLLIHTCTRMHKLTISICSGGKSY